ncbi:izumo sperm-egg fusion protein 4 isoform X2 [Peromyscus californicus insignis]|uniref:izumo sperm-egg fusion protein 4 isoform X2 n=1 Tax=Peromyscus californicus insignis TaxID=564181 RepID=UPI0022A698E5|nr:izumo sperm-egg fusion protein 4 isoform X2 [Peromyscus californicus insignis]
MDGHCGPGQAMALLLCLGMTAALARGCLHCDPKFSEKFSFYRHHVNLKSWWVGDIPVSGVLLTEWSQNTMKELHLAIPAEITREKLEQVAGAVYQRMDQLYQGKMYFPGYFPNELRAIFREQVRLIQNAIIESRIDCQRHCATAQTHTSSALAITASMAEPPSPLPLGSWDRHPGSKGFWASAIPHRQASPVFPQVIGTVAVSCTGSSELHTCLAPSGCRQENHPRLPFTDHKVSGTTAPG